MKKNIFLYFTCLIGLLGLLAGCSSDQNEDTHKDHTAANGDIREETASVDTLPSFLDDKDDNMRLIYSSAAKNPELLQYIPCYCGCGDSAGHESNLNCFVYKTEGDKVVWDDHGTRCELCLKIAAESIVKYKNGESIKQIRTFIDEQYKEGYAKPTPTPMPS
ncbi:PCYCGC motif-containing (lipo)protein [Rossellomorea vietnamensis]|uniref:PCYCGC motif-containing (lipo)protein n=1 Tax=Rossellomorea vietnamensis TaxID=218284 RepID=UPI000552176B|nr:PCYCGC motif-containing (lipo)protein [Rossellomorea vietnamensis]MCC5800495.1 hypothetical protein [Rossellomorea vietnamensis]OXS62224.1 hypothetical protein B1B00_08220 [Bacillus sp. DSM 27956]PRX77546.1 uncharacterized protein with PCYCGC motif [Bacillus sp. V-88]SLK20586.1 Protein of unknown function with PCYCGC motif-containing protein [Bacillus sp. V-88]